MESARDHVFRLPELLELILSHLPQKDLLLSQRVSPLFRTTITESPKLQRLLFLLPDWRLTPTKPAPQPTNNRLILRAFPGCYPTVSLIIGTTPHQSTFTSTTTKTWDVCIAFPASSPPLIHHASVSYPEASWRKMYLCQPPAKRLHLVRRWQRSRSPAIVREMGITMGDFYDEATGGKGRGWERRFISSDRDWHFEGSIQDGVGAN